MAMVWMVTQMVLSVITKKLNNVEIRKACSLFLSNYVLEGQNIFFFFDTVDIFYLMLNFRILLLNECMLYIFNIEYDCVAVYDNTMA